MLACTARRAAAPPWILGMLAALSTLSAGAPALAVGAGSPANPPSLSAIPKSLGSKGLVAGLWIDPSTSQLGSMTGELYDELGNVEYSLVATTSEYIATGPSLRFGGISGELYKGTAPAGIQVSGDWILDPATGKGTFDVTCYLGAVSPTAPLLAIGSMYGVLGKATASTSGGDEEEAVPVASGASGSVGNLGGALKKKGSAGPGGGGGTGTLVQRDFRGRWTMI